MLNNATCPKIISDGYMYGRVCSTGGQYITLEGVGECHSQTTPAEFKQEERIENATHIYSRYGIVSNRITLVPSLIVILRDI